MRNDRVAVTACCLVSLLLITAAPAAAEFKDPASFTREEYQMVHAARAKYDACLQEEALKAAQQSNDPRQAADTAMKACAAILEGLHMQIIQRNYAPEVARKFSWNMSNRSANKLLSNLMRYMATRESTQSAQPAAAEQP